MGIQCGLSAVFFDSLLNLGMRDRNNGPHRVLKTFKRFRSFDHLDTFHCLQSTIVPEFFNQELQASLIKIASKVSPPSGQAVVDWSMVPKKMVVPLKGQPISGL